MEIHRNDVKCVCSCLYTQERGKCCFPGMGYKVQSHVREWSDDGLHSLLPSLSWTSDPQQCQRRGFHRLQQRGDPAHLREQWTHQRGSPSAYTGRLLNIYWCAFEISVFKPLNFWCFFFCRRFRNGFALLSFMLKIVSLWTLRASIERKCGCVTVLLLIYFLYMVCSLLCVCLCHKCGRYSEWEFIVMKRIHLVATTHHKVTHKASYSFEWIIKMSLH